MSGNEEPEYVVAIYPFQGIPVNYKASKIELRYSFCIVVYTAVYNIQRIYVLSTKCIYVFCMDLRAKSNYFPV
jgi:hypothetical protein